MQDRSRGPGCWRLLLCSYFTCIPIEALSLQCSSSFCQHNHRQNIFYRLSAVSNRLSAMHRIRYVQYHIRYTGSNNNNTQAFQERPNPIPHSQLTPLHTTKTTIMAHRTTTQSILHDPQSPTTPKPGQYCLFFGLVCSNKPVGRHCILTDARLACAVACVLAVACLVHIIRRCKQSGRHAGV